MDENIRIRKNPNVVSRVIGDETVLLPIYKTSDEINCIYTFNKVASRLWEMFDGKRTILQIKAQALKEFRATPQSVDKELSKFLKELQKIKAIKC